jgi:hypothetical protein
MSHVHRFFVLHLSVIARAAKARPGIGLVAAAILVSASTADAQRIEPTVLKKVKDATVYISVKSADGSVSEGSGFLHGPKGMVVTNAHVVNMLDNQSRKPARILVTIHSGEENSRTVPAQVHFVDGEFDLALLRIPIKDGPELPERLNLIEPGTLVETQDLFIFGFPLGKQIGSNVTVTPTTITSLRKENGALKTIQINGGLHPGNSGGPLVTKEGAVAGIAVAAYSGTQIHLAIPIESLNIVTNGRIVTSLGVAYKDENRIHVPVRIERIDPLGRMKSISVQTWTGPPLKPGEHERPAARKEPEPRPGDSPITTIELTSDSKGVFQGQIVLSEEKDAKSVYWWRCLIDKGTSTHWYPERVLFSNLDGVVERKSAILKFAPPLGRTDVIALSSNGAFRICETGHAEFTAAAILNGTVKEQFNEQTKTGVWRKQITYDGLTVTPTRDKQRLEGNDKLLKALNDIKLMTSKVDVRKDGTIIKHTSDLSKVPQDSVKMLQLVTKQTRQSLDSLSVPLPPNEIKPLDRWTAKQTFMVGAVRWIEEAEADLTYTYHGIATRDNKQFALISFEGDLQRSVDEDQKKNKAMGRAEGRVEISLETGLVNFATQNIRAELDMTESPDTPAKGVGTLNVLMRRNPRQSKK